MKTLKISEEMHNELLALKSLYKCKTFEEVIEELIFRVKPNWEELYKYDKSKK